VRHLKVCKWYLSDVHVEGRLLIGQRSYMAFLTHNWGCQKIAHDLLKAPAVTYSIYCRYHCHRCMCLVYFKNEYLGRNRYDLHDIEGLWLILQFLSHERRFAIKAFCLYWCSDKINMINIFKYYICKFNDIPKWFPECERFVYYCISRNTLTHIYMTHFLSWFGTGTSINSDRVQLDWWAQTSPLSELIMSCTCMTMHLFGAKETNY
jgi:hypothetical protein